MMRFIVALWVGWLAGVWLTETKLWAEVLHGPVRNAANGHVYFLLAPNSWTDSEAEAAALGGHLATVNDVAESAWLQQTFGEWGGLDRGLWIGLNDARLEGDYEWASGDPVSFRFWRIQFPSDPTGEADYVFIDYASSIYGARWRNTRNDNFEPAPDVVVCGVVEIAPEGEPVLSVSRAGGQMRIDFTGALLRGDSVAGPWVEVTNAVSPFWVETGAGDVKRGEITTKSTERTKGVEGPERTGMGRSNEQRLGGSLAPPAEAFFRARGPESIFDRRGVIELGMEGPFQEHFEKAFAGMPDGINPPVREKPWFEGEVVLTIAGLERPVEVRVRGNSSLQECPFPKLKFKLSRADRAGTPFFNAREIKVGTHCAEGGRGTIGRLRDERATWREALAYEIMAALKFTGPRVRRAEIEYRDTSTNSAAASFHRVEGEVGWVLKRKALVLEDVEVVAERLGGRALDDEEIANLTNANFGAQLVADLRLLHALLGNWDYALSEDGSNMWNFDVIESAGTETDRSYIPIAGDFDLCSFVTEEVQLNAPWDFFPELPPLARETRWDIQVVANEVSAEVFETGKERFKAKRSEIESRVNFALIDEAGRTNAVAHVAAFFEALEAVSGAGGKPVFAMPKPAMEK